MTRISSKELTLKGSRNATREDFEYVIKCMEEGKIHSASYISHQMPVVEAITYFQDKTFNTNKALIVY